MTKRPHFHGHRQRLRRRFLKGDADALPDYELLELVLCLGQPRGDVKPQAKALLERFGSFAEAISAEPKALAEIDGVGEAAIAALKTVQAAAQRLTKGAGVPVVYDAVGKSTWEGSLACLQPRGLMVSFGNASGAVDPVPLGQLGAAGSIYVTRPTLMTYNAQRKALEASARALFNVVMSGKVKIEINQRYALADIKQAHIDLEGRKTTGSSVLMP